MGLGLGRDYGTWESEQSQREEMIMTKASEGCQGAGGIRCPHENAKTTRTGPRSPWLCATCRRALRSNRRAAGATKRIERIYGLSEADLSALRSALPVNGRGVPVCPICRRATGATKALAVDHDHALVVEPDVPIRDSVRGILCGPCNQLIGRYGIVALERAIQYLKHPPAFRVLGTNVDSGTPSMYGEHTDNERN